MIEYFKKIKLDIPLINPNFDMPSLQRKCEIFPIHRIFQLELNAINPELINWFEEKDILIKAFIFLTPPKKNSLIHIDGKDFNTCWAMNWAWGCDDHEMNWYTPITADSPISSKVARSTTSAGTTYRTWDESEVIKVASTKIDGPTICSIGAPHRVENRSLTTRWSISIRPQIFTKWDVAMKVFSKEIKEYADGC